MISTIVGRFTAKELLEILPQLRFPALSMVILLAIAVAVAHLFLIDKKHQGLFVSMFLILIRFLWDFPSIKRFLGIKVFLMSWFITCVTRHFSGLLGLIWFKRWSQRSHAWFARNLEENLLTTTYGLHHWGDFGSFKYQTPSLPAEWFPIFGQFDHPFVDDFHWDFGG